MKQKLILTIIFSFTIIVCMVSLGFNIYFLATQPKKAGGVFNDCKNSILELKAETSDVGVSYGTAELISTDGKMITNTHIITYSQLGKTFTFDNIFVRFIDEEAYREVTIIKYDIDLDIAIFKLNVLNRVVKPIKIGDSSKISSGDDVYAIGNLSNYGLSISKGIISIPSINVSYNSITRNVIQCDLTISDGNSGGALVDSDGNLIGVTTFRLKDQSNNIIYGISYCIPINTILEYIKTPN